MIKGMKESNGYLISGAIIICLLLFIAIFGDWLAPYTNEEKVFFIKDPDTGQIIQAPFSPSLQHLFGTDAYGKDIFSKIMYGAKYTVFVVLIIGLSRLLLSLPIGLLAGWNASFKKPLSYMNRVWNAVPIFILVYFLLQTIVKIPVFSTTEQILLLWAVLTFAGLPPLVESIRGHVERIRRYEFMEGVKVLGGGMMYTIRKHVFPHLAPHLFIILALEISQVLWLLGQLGIFDIFVGGTIVKTNVYGPPEFHSATNEWAGLLGQARNYVRSAPWIAFAPALMFFISIFGFNLLAEGLRRKTNKNTVLYEYE